MKNSRLNKFKLKPLYESQNNRYLSVKKQKSLIQFSQINKGRYKTQPDQQEQGIFPNVLGIRMRYLSTDNNPIKGKLINRKLSLFDSDQKKFPKTKDQIKIKIDEKVNKSKKVLFKLQQKIQLQNENKQKQIDGQFKLVFNIKCNKLNQFNKQNLECNIIHIMKIWISIKDKKQAKQIINLVKNYVLEDGSDLNDFQTYFEGSSKKLIKQIIFYQRTALIFLIESIITRRRKNAEMLLQQIFKDLLSFYSTLYFKFENKTLQSLCESKKIFYNGYHHINKSSFLSLFSLKQTMDRHIQLLSRQFTLIDQFIKKQSNKVAELPTNLSYYYLLQFYATRLSGLDWSSWGIQFLQTCPSPYIHHTSKHKYTLILDLDQTLVHFKTKNQKGQFLLRPYLFQFLKKMSEIFEIGVFTCGLKDYADLILQHLPWISFRLYRQHAIKIGQQLIKDLSRVGRDLSNVILVDNLSKNFRMQPQNGIHILSWYGDRNDKMLLQVGNQLQNIWKANPSDIRLSSHKRSFL